MAYIDFKKLKGRVPIADILAHYGLLDGLEESSQGYEGCCPFCGSGSFKVNVERNVWFCFGDCKEEAEGRGARNGGNILDFVVRKEGVSVKCAAQKIAGWFPKEDGAAGTKESAPKAVAAAKGEQAPEPPAKPAGEGQGSTTPPSAASEPAEASGHEDLEEDLTGRSNAPLEFTLKSISFEHPVLEGLGLSRSTLTAFGVGYFTGKGMMHNKVVIPFHNADGLLVAYAGYSPETRSYTYPKGFDPRLELYNVWRVANAGLGDNTGVVLVTDLLNVLRLHELGVTRALAMPTEMLFPPQLAKLHSLVGAGGRVDFAPWTKEYVDTLAELLPHFHVRLHRYYNGSEDEFLSQLVSSLGW
jgi:hypothetical protein